MCYAIMKWKALITCFSSVSIQTEFGFKSRNDVISDTMREGKGDGFCARMLASVVYFIWQKRNSRIFKDAMHNWEYVLCKINENVRGYLVPESEKRV